MNKKYEFKDFVFDINMEYNEELFWKVYRIYKAYSLCIDEKVELDLDYCSAVVGDIGQFYFKELNNKASKFDEEYFQYLLYKKILLSLDEKYYGQKKYKDIVSKCKNIEELKNIYYIEKQTKEDKKLPFYEELIKETKNKWNIDVKTLTECFILGSLNNYIQRLSKFIPKNIISKIKDIRVFALGVMTEEVYNEMLQFRNTLEKWLENLIATNKKYEIKSTEIDLGNFHDQIYKIYFENNDLIFIGNYDEIIKFKNCNILYINNNYKFNYDKVYELEGYTYNSVYRLDSNKIELHLEVIADNFSSLIVECDDFELIDNKENK